MVPMIDREMIQGVFRKLKSVARNDLRSGRIGIFRYWLSLLYFGWRKNELLYRIEVLGAYTLEEIYSSGKNYTYNSHRILIRGSYGKN